EIRRGRLRLVFDLVAELFVLALELFVSAQEIEHTMLRGGHEPGARVVWDARLWPALECSDERLLGKLLGETHVAHDPRQASDEPGRLDSPDCVDRAMRLGCLQGSRSDHVSQPAQARAAATNGVGLPPSRGASARSYGSLR